jgi:S-adenosylmethionine/arginine decarboxylase-like enzyme
LDIKSQHLLVDLWLKESIEEIHITAICKVIEDNLTVLERAEHKFEPVGQTIVFVLGESHFTLHTYPEHKYMTFDIYVCNMNVDLELILSLIETDLPIKHKEIKFITRGISEEFQELSMGVEDELIKSKILYAVTFVLAACSIIYELLLAQTLSSTMGNTALRYNITIGLYIASMGVGALVFNKLIKSSFGERLIRIEVVLAIIGGLAPIIVLLNDSFINLLAQKLNLNFFGFFTQSLLSGMNHGLIIVVGFLSGLELPLLIELGKKIKTSIGTKVLAMDYVGSLIGVIAFPLVIFPNFTLFTIGFLIAFINASVAIYLTYFYKVNNKRLKFCCFSLASLYFLLLCFSEYINDFILQKIYFYNL